MRVRIRRFYEGEQAAPRVTSGLTVLVLRATPWSVRRRWQWLSPCASSSDDCARGGLPGVEERPQWSWRIPSHTSSSFFAPSRLCVSSPFPRRRFFNPLILSSSRCRRDWRFDHEEERPDASAFGSQDQPARAAQVSWFLLSKIPTFFLPRSQSEVAQRNGCSGRYLRPVFWECIGYP
ncbi:hypothetical protein Pla8534_28290 [Lignipirellula cremea]|uniref:Uncharacterized protein n=1 Tax=Lignipirellula cremea TaxID=2528010 RepID=A0A518DT59_9BACT|nr:hypothetical protein Pla8534_28290 [Lignipirellula cremea]